MHSCGSLRHLTILVSQELLLVSQTIANVRVIVALIGHHFIKEVLVVDFCGFGINLCFVCRVFFEHMFALLYVSHNFLWLEYADSPLTDIKLESRSSTSHSRVTGALPLAGVAGRSGSHV